MIGEAAEECYGSMPLYPFVEENNKLRFQQTTHTCRGGGGKLFFPVRFLDSRSSTPHPKIAFDQIN